MSLFKKATLLIVVFCLASSFAYAASEAESSPPVTISTSQLAQFETYPSNIKILVNEALLLAGDNLTYKYGSADPKQGGMDCSGTIYYLLNQLGIKNVPRQANQIYQWAWEQGHFYAVNSNNFSSFEFSHLKAGDLLFWSGTYDVNRDPPVTHVMIYLGKSLTSGSLLMFGSSDGRTYNGKSIWGVSVFDFNLPAPGSKSKFLGYSCIPDYSC